MQSCCLDIQKLIMNFSYGAEFTYEELLRDIHFVLDVRDSINRGLFRPICLDKIQQRLVPTPYVHEYPYHPHRNLERVGVFGDVIRYLSYYIRDDFFKRIHSYRTVFERYLSLANCFGLSYWNIIFNKYFIHFEQDDFVAIGLDAYFDIKMSLPILPPGH